MSWRSIVRAIFLKPPVAASNAARAACAGESRTRNGAAGSLVVGAACLLILAGMALAVDVQIARAVRTAKSSGEVRNFVRLAETFAWGGTVGMIIVAAWALDSRRWRIVPRLAIGGLGAGIAADLAKLVIARTRPKFANLEGTVDGTFVAWLPDWREHSLGLIYTSKLQSFPSGHAATAVGLAVALSVLYPRGRWLFATFAVLAAVQRIHAGAHFPSDVLAGASIGCLVGAMLQADGDLGRWLARLEGRNGGGL